MADSDAKPLSDEEESNPLKKKQKALPGPSSEKSAAESNEAETSSVQLEVNLDDKPKDPKTTFNFRKPTFTGDILKQKTEAEVNNPPPPQNPNPSSGGARPTQNIEEVRAQIIAEENSEANKMTYEDYEDTADFIIDLVDMALVFGIRWISLDTTDAPYEVPKDKVLKLKKHLTRLLVRMNKKFPMGLLLLIAILAAYGTPLRKGLEHRKLVLSEKAKKKKEKQAEAGESEDVNPLKKKRGGVGK